ncbi:RteC protein [Tangfeifania diversioriginum]|uniref:RteC protein n=1 Tax=Tangfeifania diversioriginum TaxID=1168035 RepID=A0A1M6NJX2_9BACT|nr:RteC protein [Tangfeifania diversioriginum]
MFLDHLIHYVQVEIECTKLRIGDKINTNNLNIYKGLPLTWTASKRALLELIYALHLTMSINHGRISIKELVGFFSHTFNIPLPGYHSTIKKLTARSANVIHVESRSFFLNELVTEFNHKLEFLDEN